MNTSTIQRNQIVRENTSVGSCIAPRNPKRAVRPFVALACLVAAMICTQVAKPSELSRSVSANQSLGVVDCHRADIIDDILDILDQLLGGGSGTSNPPSTP